MNDEEAIRDVMRRWMAATKAGDTASVMELMTDVAVFLTPARAPFGKAVAQDGHCLTIFRKEAGV